VAKMFMVDGPEVGELERSVMIRMIDHSHEFAVGDEEGVSRVAALIEDGTMTRYRAFRALYRGGAEVEVAPAWFDAMRLMTIKELYHAVLAEDLNTDEAADVWAKVHCFRTRGADGIQVSTAPLTSLKPLFWLLCASSIGAILFLAKYMSEGP
jgi:hypothetical protein